MEQSWWNNGTSNGGTVNRDGGTVEHVMVEQWNNNGGTLTQRWGNSGTCDVETVTEEQWNKAGGKVEHMLELGLI